MKLQFQGFLLMSSSFVFSSMVKINLSLFSKDCFIKPELSRYFRIIYVYSPLRMFVTNLVSYIQYERCQDIKLNISRKCKKKKYIYIYHGSRLPKSEFSCTIKIFVEQFCTLKVAKNTLKSHKIHPKEVSMC